MKLLTHNRLVCVRKGCNNAFPLQIVFRHVEQEESEPRIDMVLHLLPRIDYPVLLAAARELGFSELPDELPMNLNETEHRELLELLYTVLFDVQVMEGDLVCPVCEVAYPIQQGIPNLRIDEAEL